VIKIILDIDLFFEEEFIERRASEWRAYQISDLCESYGWQRGDFHAYEGGCDLQIEKWTPSEGCTAFTCLEGLYSHLMELQEKWNTGYYNEDLYNSFSEIEEPYEY